MNLDHSTRSAMLAAMPQLRTFAISLCRDRDRANDLTQEAFLLALTNIDKFKAGSNMTGWLFTILRNQYYTDHRKRRREVEDVNGTYAEMLIAEPEQMARLEQRDLSTALAELPSEMCKPLLLVGVEGASYDEAADACNCSVGTIKSRVHRARTRLAERLSVDRHGNPLTQSMSSPPMQSA
jgi:RNA polymerase sigma-70 factor (ECF subfamily)